MTGVQKADREIEPSAREESRCSAMPRDRASFSLGPHLPRRPVADATLQAVSDRFLQGMESRILLLTIGYGDALLDQGQRNLRVKIQIHGMLSDVVASNAARIPERHLPRPITGRNIKGGRPRMTPGPSAEQLALNTNTVKRCARMQQTSKGCYLVQCPRSFRQHHGVSGYVRPPPQNQRIGQSSSADAPRCRYRRVRPRANRCRCP